MKKLITGVLLSLFAMTAAYNVSAAEKSDQFLAQRHMAKGLKCTSCHGDANNPKIETDRCLKCHGGWEGLAKKTYKKSIYAGGPGLYLDDANPHDNHLGHMSCDNCHKGHSESKEENSVCYKCHTFGWKIP